MKAQRQAAIIDLVRRHRVPSQEDLRGLLRDEGFEVTQATLSRDLRELGLVKVADPDGGAHYAAPPPAPEAVHPPLAQLAQALLLSAVGVGPLLVVRTPAGSANALGSALDHAAWPEVLGTIAGDDTILIIARSEAARRTVADRLEELAGSGG